jgi:hypothetical protein
MAHENLQEPEVSIEHMLTWLFQCYHNSFLAVPDVPHAHRLAPSAEGAGFASLSLEYEPRCLAVSPEGPRVAVGTKAGTIHVLTWDPASARWKDVTIGFEQAGDGPEHRPGEPRRRAIRAIAMLDARTVAAGWGEGAYRIVELPADPGATPHVFNVAPAAQVRSSESGWRRFTRIIRLYGLGKRPLQGGQLALGLSRGFELHILHESAGYYSVYSRDPQHVLRGWQPNWGRLVDGGWSRDYLWLLTSSGTIACLQADETSELPFLPLRIVDHAQIVPYSRATEFRGLDGCAKGLSVHTSDAVTFLRFEQLHDAPPKVEGAAARWFPVPNAVDCTVSCPYYTWPPAPQDPDGAASDDERVWTVVATGKPELRWIAWPERGGPWLAPPLFRGVASSVLYVRFGWPLSGRPPFLAVSTRDHQLEVATVLHRAHCEHDIEELIGALESTWPDQSAALREIGGARLWALLRRVERDFALAVTTHSDIEWPVPLLLDNTTEDDLRKLLLRVLRAWEKGQLEDRTEARRLVIDRTLDLLKRAHRFEPRAARDLAVKAFEWIVGGRGVDPSGASADPRRELGLFALFLRKWIINGYTYGEKTRNLVQLYGMNRDCQRNLDAVVYLAKVMHDRVDVRWSAMQAHSSFNPGIWALVASGEAQQSHLFTVASFTDGTICAVSGSGVALPWIVDDDKLAAAHLQIDHDRRSISHLEAAAFRDKYRHGPYARSLLLQRWDVAREAATPLYLLFFCLRGWRPDDQQEDKAKKPLACALLLRPLMETREAGDQLSCILVEDVASCPIAAETYGLCPLPRAADGVGGLRLLAGTPGTWPGPGGEYRVCPFVELEIATLDDTHLARPVCRDTAVEVAQEGLRSLFRDSRHVSDTAYNPCWKLVCKESPDRVWIWAGFHEGSIRGFGGQWSAENRCWRWMEGGWPGVPGGRPRRKGLKVSAAVWSLQLVADAGGTPLLAYGTGDGTLGAVALQDLDGDSAGAEGDDAVCHLVHTRESSPISGLCTYVDEGHRLLLGVTQQGTVCIFVLSRAAAPEKQPGNEVSVNFAGDRLDHFNLDTPARAALLIQDSYPCLLTADDHGYLHYYDLRYPRRTARRTEVRERLFSELMEGRESGTPPDFAGTTTADLAATVGAGRGLEWLRVFDTGGTSLIELSLWQDLWGHWPAALAATGPLDDAALLERDVTSYSEHLKLLATEVYGRRPFVPYSKEPAKVLWEVTSRIAHLLLDRTLNAAPEETALSCYLRLVGDIDDLCNRWIGFEQSIEAKVLAHSFEALFGWSEIVLLAGWGPDSAQAALIRGFLLRNMAQRRLFHSDPIVPLEAMRVLNSALIRGLLRIPALLRPSEAAHWEPRLRPVALQPGSPGFYDLIAMVGDLAERLADRLTSSEPLRTEILRFFALTLLLFPSSSLIVAQAVSESRLTERDSSFARAVVKQASSFRRDLHLGKEVELTAALQRFAAYLTGPADLYLAEYDPATPEAPDPKLHGWRYLLWTAHHVEDPEHDLSDASFLRELRGILLTASWLSQLGESDFCQPTRRPMQRPGTAQEAALLAAASQTAANMLAKRADDWGYFKHSAAYLRQLAQLRDSVLALAAQDQQQRPGRPLREAIERCTAELRVLDARDLDRRDLFEPQRSQYKTILRSWRDQLIGRAEEAAQALETLDLFNSHVFRTSADHLMTSVTELAMQAAPISFDESSSAFDKEREWQSFHEGSTRLLIQRRLEGQPLVRDVFERSDRLVDHTHLSGALLVLARDYLRASGALEITPGITVEELRYELEDAGRGRGLIPPGDSCWPRGTAAVPDNVRVPGTRAVWAAIFREFATNIARYGAGGGSDLSPDQASKLWADLVPTSAGRDSLLIAGTSSFLWTLKTMRPETYQKLCSGNDAEIDKTKVDEFLRDLAQHEDVELATAPGAGGMGLFLISRISKLLGIENHLILFDVHSRLLGAADLSTVPWSKEQQWPLCLQLQWKRL